VTVRKQLPLEHLAVERGGHPTVQVWGTRGMVTSMHPAATDVAAQVLREGGNAVDAAIALGAAISVTSHDWSGIAGDSAWLIYLAGSRSYRYLDGYSVCPEGTTPQLLTERFGLDRRRDNMGFREEPPQQRDAGVVTAMVPGTPAAWCELAAQHGRLPLAKVLEPAIALAERGVVLNRYVSDAFQRGKPKLQQFESSRAVFFDDEAQVPREGQTLRQPDLAETLRRLARKGRSEFYQGDTANQIVDFCRRNGGTITLRDLAAYQARWRPVVRGTYRGREIVVCGPPTAGPHVIQGLNVLEGYDLAASGYHTEQTLHRLIECLKLCLIDRRAHGGDPDFQLMDLTETLSKQAAAALRSKIADGRASTHGEHAVMGESTTHFVVADADGNIVNATQTIGSAFGCGEVVSGTGMLMNDRTWWMALEEGPNIVSPGHRANIGHAPTIVAENGQPCIALGSPGGFGIIQYVIQTLVNVLDHGLDLQSAIEAPRFKIEDLAGRVAIERSMPERVRTALAAMGHKIEELPEWTDRVGGVEGIYVAQDSGNFLGGYDPRRNSLASGIH